MMTKLLLILMVVGLWSGCGKELKIHTEKYDNGKVKEEYQYYRQPGNGKRIKEGWYKSYYKNGYDKELGPYKEDKRDGEWIHYTEDGKETKGFYKDGTKWSGEFWIHVEPDSSRNLKETNNEINDDNGVMRGRFSYSNGVWNGSGVTYWENGTKRIESNYVNGTMAGKFIIYWPNGTMQSEGNRVNGKYEGKSVFYFRTGSILAEGYYVDGKKQGVWIRYDANGNITKKVTYEYGEVW